MKRLVLAGLLLGLGVRCAPRRARQTVPPWASLRQRIVFPSHFRGEGAGYVRTGNQTWKVRFHVRWDPDTIRWLVRGWMGLSRQGKHPWSAFLPGGSPQHPLPSALQPESIRSVAGGVEAWIKLPPDILLLQFSSRGDLVSVKTREGTLRILDRLEGPDGWVPRRVHWVSPTSEFTAELRRWSWSPH